jgi:hypothetical protein
VWIQIMWMDMYVAVGKVFARRYMLTLLSNRETTMVSVSRSKIALATFPSSRL